MRFMYRKLSLVGALALVLLTVLALVAPAGVSAHGRRDLVGGKYQVVIGFLTEPAYAGLQNGIDLTVCQGQCVTQADGTLQNPVKDADKTLKAEVIYGSQTLPVQLAPRFRADGKYNGYFFPSKAGEYTFHLTGTINNDKIDERFVSGKDGFNSVEDPTPLQFPAVQSSVSNLDQQVKSAEDKASTATVFGIIGLVVGVLGLGVAAFALLRKPRVMAEGERELVASRSRKEQQGG